MEHEKASVSVDWYFHYRFYDPSFKSHPRIKGKKQVLKGGINKFKLLTSGKTRSGVFLENEKDLLLNKAYNPITGQISEPESVHYEIDPRTPFIKALREAHKKLDKVKTTLSDISSGINDVEKAAPS